MNSTDRLQLAKISLWGLSIGETFLLDNYQGHGGTALSIFAPIGAYFHQQVDEVVEQVQLAAGITHFHEEAIAGAISVALAACICTRYRLLCEPLSAEPFYDFIVTHMPESDVKYKIKKAATLPSSYDIRTIVAISGNGVELTAHDTVPFAMWCIANHTDSFSEAIRTGVSGPGDRDTITAIVGSIVVLIAGEHTIPAQWIVRAERFDSSPFFTTLPGLSAI